MNLKLRNWQSEALVKAYRWLVEEGIDKHFLINAAPGAGKTLVACVIAKTLIDRTEIDRVIVIAPRAEVVNVPPRAEDDEVLRPAAQTLGPEALGLRPAPGGAR